MDSGKRAKGLKIAVAGKGGVGKTTLAAALAKICHDQGRPVIAVDVDSDANLASAVGLSATKAAKITPISQLKGLIFDRTGADPNVRSSFFSLNPKVDDIPDRYYADVDGIKIMEMGTVDYGGSGCICPESAFIRRLIQHLVLERDEVVIMDMEAGVEHLGRATAQSVDLLLVVVEPGLRSLQTAKSILKLAVDLELVKILGVANKMQNSSQRKVIARQLSELNIIGWLPEDAQLRQADLEGKPPWEASSKYMAQVKSVWEEIKRQCLTT